MPVEIWDLYDAQGKKTGKTMIRGEQVPPGMYHIVVHIWPLNSRGEFLIQRRALTLQWKPGIWAGTGGSAVSGEDPLTAARRELREELGYDAACEEMHLGARLRRPDSFCYVFSLRMDREEDAFVLQKEEVSAVRWCSVKRMENMLAENTLYNYGDAYLRTLFEYQKACFHA